MFKAITLGIRFCRLSVSSCRSVPRRPFEKLKRLFRPLKALSFGELVELILVLPYSMAEDTWSRRNVWPGERWKRGREALLFLSVYLIYLFVAVALILMFYESTAFLSRLFLWKIK